MYNKKFKPIAHSEVNITTFKRILVYIVICTIGCVVGMGLYSLYGLKEDFFSTYYGVILVIAYMIIFSAIEAKYIWKTLIILYPIHERDVQPLTIGILFGYVYKMLVT